MTDIALTQDTLQNTPYLMTEESIAVFLQTETERGASAVCLRQRKAQVTALYCWLHPDKVLSRERLAAWRQSLLERGYSADTVGNYVKSVNRYLNCLGWGELRFRQGGRRDLGGRQFGYLTAIAPTDGRDRRDVVWACRCRCGKTVEVTAVRLLSGNTLSCGCVKTGHLHNSNRYIGNTSIRQSLQENEKSTRAASGFTGVTAKRGKWAASITYRGRTYSLGCYAKLEDAVKARARAKELVQEDARQLEAVYEALHRSDPELPRRNRKSKQQSKP